jgi:hypothetical protein
VRFCTFCGLEVRNSTDSIEAGRKLRQEEAAVRSHIASPNDDDADLNLASGDFDFDDDDNSASALTEELVM